MKKTLKVLAWIFGIPLGLIIIILALGYSAVRWNFWPPTCEVLPLPQAKMVCEFSKLDKAPKEKDALYTFHVTIPYTTPAGEEVFLSIDGKDPIEMEKVNNTTWQKLLTLKTGDKISYKYTLSIDKINSTPKELAITRLSKNIYDKVNAWEDKYVNPKIAITPGVNMFDTWSINYNFNFFEDTRFNIKSTIKRIKTLGAKEIGVYSFLEMMGTKDDFTLGPVSTPYKYMRDASITRSEMKKIVNNAHSENIKVALHYNIEADYTKYFNVKDIGTIGKGIGGDLAESRVGKDLGRDEKKDKTYIDRYMTQLQTNLVSWAKEAEIAGIDIIDITPQYRPPKMLGQDEYADKKYGDMIKAIREVYKGKIYASNFNQYGNFTYPYKPTYINDVDGLYVYIGLPDISSNPSVSEIRSSYEEILNEIKQNYYNYKKPLILIASIPSYDGALNGKPGVEYNDFKEVDDKGYKENWQLQANAYEGLFEALAGDSTFAGIQTSGYWWDDLMAPKYMGPKNNLHPTIRNKPAEAVFEKWFGN